MGKPETRSEPRFEVRNRTVQSEMASVPHLLLCAFSAKTPTFSRPVALVPSSRLRFFGCHGFEFGARRVSNATCIGLHAEPQRVRIEDVAVNAPPVTT